MSDVDDQRAEAEFIDYKFDLLVDKNEALQKQLSKKYHIPTKKLPGEMPAEY
jgi:hypothetical protein